MAARILTRLSQKTSDLLWGSRVLGCPLTNTACELTGSARPSRDKVSGGSAETHTNAGIWIVLDGIRRPSAHPCLWRPRQPTMLRVIISDVVALLRDNYNT